MGTLRHIIGLPLLALCGCAVGPTYREPAVAVPAAYSVGRMATESDEEAVRWWSVFGDQVLDDLVARASGANLDIRQAAARVAQARARQEAVRADALPAVSANAQAGYTKFGSNALQSSLGGLGSVGGPAVGSVGTGGKRFGFGTFQAGFDASWELDVFGGQRRANEAASARVEEAVWSLRDAQVLLTAEVVKQYQQLRSVQRRLAVIDEVLVVDEQLLQYTRVRARNGLTNTLDERHQQGVLDADRAQRADLAAQADAHVHAISALLALPPTALADELAGPPPAPAAPVDIPVGLPSDLLRRRPDIRSAERRVAAGTADIGVAVADLYPKFSLTGALQLVSTSLARLFASGSLLASATGGVTLPLFGRDASHATVHLREAETREDLLAYQGAVVGALRDVEDALTRLAADRKRADALTSAEDAARDASDTLAVRYRTGLVANSDVLAARRNDLSAHDALLESQAATAQDVVALYKALGGGWDDRRINEDDPSGRSE